MSWRDNLQPASFRGVTFFVEDMGGDFGRRVVTHKYPGRDDPHHEDLGAAIDGFTFSGYVLEPDHMAKAEQLRQVLSEKGPGTLVHPYWGEVQVRAMPTRESITSRDGGMVRFSLRFQREGGNFNPRAKTDTASLLSERAASIDTSAVSDFALNFNVDGSPGWVEDAAEADLGTVLGGVDTAGGELTAAAEAADLAFEIADMTAGAQDLVRDPATLASRLLGAVKSLPGIGPTMTLATSTFELATITATTPSRLRQANNRAALVDLVNRVSLSASIRNLPGETFTAATDAYQARDDIATAADTLTLTASDDVVRAITKGAAGVVRHVSAIAPALPRRLRIVPQATRPAVVHAYTLYGDDIEAVSDRADQLVTRNRIRHPGMTPAAEALEVLSNG